MAQGNGGNSVHNGERLTVQERRDRLARLVAERIPDGDVPGEAELIVLAERVARTVHASR